MAADVMESSVFVLKHSLEMTVQVIFSCKIFSVHFLGDATLNIIMNNTFTVPTPPPPSLLPSLPLVSCSVRFCVNCSSDGRICYTCERDFRLNRPENRCEAIINNRLNDAHIIGKTQYIIHVDSYIKSWQLVDRLVSPRFFTEKYSWHTRLTCLAR